MQTEPGNGNEARFRTLRELGLTEYQAKAYAALLRLGKGTAAQVANVTDVPRNKLYPVMQQLNALGLVETSLGEAQVFRPLPLDRFLDERLRALRTTAEQLQEGRAALLQLFRAAPGEADVAPAGYRLFHGRANMLDQLRLALREARREVWLAGTADTPARLLTSGVAEVLRERTEEGVRIHALFPEGAEQAMLRELDEAWGHGAVRVHAQLVPGALLCAVDATLAVLVQSQPEDTSITRGNDITLVTPSPIIARVVE
ncbi:MAG: hypothetical protein LC624_11255, partial [Halobacteriales archaeon]|nr:hypothetical protein [Halobacteriales archaeon]